MDRNKLKLAGAYAVGTGMIASIAIDSYLRHELGFALFWSVIDVFPAIHSALYLHQAYNTKSENHD